MKRTIVTFNQYDYRNKKYETDPLEMHDQC